MQRLGFLLMGISLISLSAFANEKDDIEKFVKKGKDGGISVLSNMTIEKSVNLQGQSFNLNNNDDYSNDDLIAMLNAGVSFCSGLTVKKGTILNLKDVQVACFNQTETKSSRSTTPNKPQERGHEKGKYKEEPGSNSTGISDGQEKMSGTTKPDTSSPQVIVNKKESLEKARKMGAEVAVGNKGEGTIDLSGARIGSMEF